MMTLTSGDYRRATALTVHYGTSNPDGCNAIFDEVLENERLVPLVYALLELHRRVVPTVLTQTGLDCASDEIIAAANDRERGPEVHRAASLVAFHAAANPDGVAEVLDAAAKDERVAETILAVCAMWKAYCPMLYTLRGLASLHQGLLDFAADEENGS